MDRTILGQVVSQAELISRRGGWKRNGQVVVCAHGAFDLLHPGHIRLLEQARSLGDVLVVAVESDTLVRDTFASSSKVPNVARPITPAAERAEILAALVCADCVIERDAPLQQFLQALAPDIVVEGAEQSRTAQPVSPPSAATAWRVVQIPHEPGYSTTSLIEKITRFPR